MEGYSTMTMLERKAIFACDFCKSPYELSNVAASVPHSVAQTFLEVFAKFKGDEADVAARVDQMRRKREQRDDGDDKCERALKRARMALDDAANLHCPRCDSVFHAFDGCAALQCAACAAHFCAFCLATHGTELDCHGHVASCPHREKTAVDNGIQGVFYSPEVIGTAQERLVDLARAEVLNGLDDGVRASILEQEERESA
jgi:hypothetical protein